MPKRLTFPSGEVGQTRNVNPYTEKMNRLPTLTSVPQSVQTSIQAANSLDNLKEAQIDTTTLHPTTQTEITDPEADTRQGLSTLAEVSKSVEPTISQPTEPTFSQPTDPTFSQPTEPTFSQPSNSFSNSFPTMTLRQSGLITKAILLVDYNFETIY